MVMNDVKKWLKKCGCVNCKVVQLTIRRGQKVETFEASITNKHGNIRQPREPSNMDGAKPAKRGTY